MIDFKAKQHEFSSFIRDPINNPPPADVSLRRMETYRDLFFNNISGFLSSNFPVIKAILDEKQWLELVQDFFSCHQNASPHFSEIPEEFIEYLQQERKCEKDFPFLLELAHYEWVEMALSISQVDIDANPKSFLEHLPQKKIALSPLAWPLVYQYPVHQISPDFLPESMPDQPTYLLVYRDKLDEVQFMLLPALSFHLLQLVQMQPNQTCQDYLQTIVQESNHPEPDNVISHGMDMLINLAEKNILIEHRQVS